MIYKGTTGNWHISNDSPPIPDRRFDWSAVHDEYDGAPDAFDERVFLGPNKTDVLKQVIEWEAQEAVEWAVSVIKR